jgi:predicted ferric reductase/Ca2+-binding EF-hand superfamily protein
MLALSSRRLAPPPSPPSASGLDASLLGILERAFAAHAGADARISPPEFQKALGLRSEYLAARVFAQFDRNRDGVIDRDEFVAGVRALVLGTDREKLRFAFDVHDHDGNGALSQDELLRMLSIAIAESDVVERATQPPEQLSRILFAAADTNHDGRITFDEFEAVMSKRPELLRKMTRSEAIWIAPNEELLVWLEDRTKTRDARLGGVLERGWAPRVFVGLWAIANVGVFALSWFAWLGGAAGQDTLIRLGRAFGKCAALDGALILLPVMRRVLGRLRATPLGRVVPFDEAIDFHRLVGHALFALALAHSVSFGAAFAVGHASAPFLRIAETERGLSGLLLLLVFVVMWVCALAFIRRTHRFELFYFTHLLYLAWLALAIAHAPTFLFWVGVPLVGFALEQAVRLSRRGVAGAILSSRALRSGVTRLEIARPAGFTFSPGDYAFLRVPAVAKREWHPFTISSAPDRAELTFHIRSLGNWTGALRRRVEEGEDEPGLTAYVDGPYGSPSGEIFRSRFAVLIGAGIGVTPFASVLESIVMRGNAESGKADKEGREAATLPTKLEKAHFFWLNKDQYSFEWFAALLAELEKSDQKGLLDIHLCMTAGRSGVTAMGLEIARQVMKAAGRSDLITGLRTHTHMGAPDWEVMLGTIAQQHRPAKVDVYFCGPPGLAKIVRVVALRHGMSFREERF